MPLMTRNNRANLAEEQPLVNNWLSMSGVLNEQQVELQRQLFEGSPIHGQMIQLESVFRLLTHMYYRIQRNEARKIPGEYRTYTVQLNLLNAPESASGALDQILPSNSRRRRMTLLATGAAALISDRQITTLQVVGTVGSLVNLPYSFCPINTRVPIESTGALYAIGNDTNTACILTIIEELFVDFGVQTRTPGAFNDHESELLDQSNLEHYHLDGDAA